MCLKRKRMSKTYEARQLDELEWHVRAIRDMLQELEEVEFSDFDDDDGDKFQALCDGRCELSDGLEYLNRAIARLRQSI